MTTQAFVKWLCKAIRQIEGLEMVGEQREREFNANGNEVFRTHREVHQARVVWSHSSRVQMCFSRSGYHRIWL